MAEQNKQQVEIIQINISGEDKPGLTSSLTEILARYDAMILDIGQANIHQTLSMGILFKTDSERAGDIMKDLLFKAYELGIQVRFKPRIYKIDSTLFGIDIFKVGICRIRNPQF